jgi:hypothetical protein
MFKRAAVGGQNLAPDVSAGQCHDSRGQTETMDSTDSLDSTPIRAQQAAFSGYRCVLRRRVLRIAVTIRRESFFYKTDGVDGFQAKLIGWWLVDAGRIANCWYKEAG